jgi:small basic protein
VVIVVGVVVVAGIVVVVTIVTAVVTIVVVTAVTPVVVATVLAAAVIVLVDTAVVRIVLDAKESHFKVRSIISNFYQCISLSLSLASGTKNLNIPSDRARQVVLGIRIGASEHVLRRTAAGITRIGCQNFKTKIHYFRIL